MKKHIYIFWLLVSWLALQSFFLFVDGWFTVNININSDKPGNLRAGFPSQPKEKTFTLSLSKAEKKVSPTNKKQNARMVYSLCRNFSSAVIVSSENNADISSFAASFIPRNFSLEKSNTRTIKGFSGQVTETTYISKEKSQCMKNVMFTSNGTIYLASALYKKTADSENMAEQFFAKLYFKSKQTKS